jgi:hypothetical protein
MYASSAERYSAGVLCVNLAGERERESSSGREAKRVSGPRGGGGEQLARRRDA